MTASDKTPSDAPYHLESYGHFRESRRVAGFFSQASTKEYWESFLSSYPLLKVDQEHELLRTLGELQISMCRMLVRDREPIMAFVGTLDIAALPQHSPAGADSRRSSFIRKSTTEEMMRLCALPYQKKGAALEAALDEGALALFLLLDYSQLAHIGENHYEKNTKQLAEYKALSQKALAICEKLVRHNARMVLSQVQMQTRRDNKHLYSEMISYGGFGLLTAIYRYNHLIKNGDGNMLKLSTFATKWILQGITRYLADNATTFRVSEHIAKQAPHVKRAITEVVERRGLKDASLVTNEELAQITGMSKESIAGLRHSWTIDSLDRPVTEEDGSASVGDLTADSQTSGDSMRQDVDRRMAVPLIRERLREMKLLEQVCIAFTFDLPDAHERQALLVQYGQEQKDAVIERINRVVQSAQRGSLPEHRPSITIIG